MNKIHIKTNASLGVYMSNCHTY